MPKEVREDILIDGELTADLDFGQMGPRLLYAEVGVEPSFDDAYGVPGLELHRDGVKKLLNALIGASKPLGRYPKGVNKLLPPIVRLPDGERILKSVHDAVELVSDFHKPIAHKFCSGMSNKLMYRESEIMNTVLLSLIDEQITALPIHDGLLVAESKADRARQVMLEVFRAKTGADGVVSVDLA